MREERIDVPEIHCDHCKKSIEGAVKAVPGVGFVTVDVPGRLVTVAYDEQAVGLDRINGHRQVGQGSRLREAFARLLDPSHRNGVAPVALGTRSGGWEGRPALQSSRS